MFAATLAYAVRSSFLARSTTTQTVVIATMGAAGIALVALQPRRCDRACQRRGGVVRGRATAAHLGVPLAVAVTAGFGIALGAQRRLGRRRARVDDAVRAPGAGRVLHQAGAREPGDDGVAARPARGRPRGAAEERRPPERTRIAAELHDVLAHSLSGAAIQLQGVRKLAEHEHATPQLAAAVERAAELVRGGLTHARQAVGALRDDSFRA